MAGLTSFARCGRVKVIVAHALIGGAGGSTLEALLGTVVAFQGTSTSVGNEPVVTLNASCAGRCSVTHFAVADTSRATRRGGRVKIAAALTFVTRATQRAGTVSSRGCAHYIHSRVARGAPGGT